MKRQIIMLVLLVALFGCTKDKSTYVTQKKEVVPPIDLFNPDGPEQSPDGFLTAGINKVKMEVEMPGGAKVMREFKYYFPISINPNKPISLVFNFHGSYTYDAGNPPPDPILSVSVTHPLNKVADSANVITVWPAGIAEPGAVNWQNSEKHIPFVKAMIAYFKAAKPTIDANRIYTCGHSSGAIFSFVLAKEMSDVFAAAVPVSGQMKLPDDFLSFAGRTVPIRAFNGVKDASVNHAAALSNINVWSEVMAGYYAKDYTKGLPVITLENYNITPYQWNGGNGNIEFYSIAEAEHSVNWTTIMPLIWEFMYQNPLNKSVGVYVGVQQDAVSYELGQKYTVPLRTSKGVDVSVVSAPEGFTVTLTSSAVVITAGPTAVDGKVILKGTLNDKIKSVEINLTKK